VKEKAMLRQFSLISRLVFALISLLLLAGCSKSDPTSLDGLKNLEPKDIYFLDSIPVIECADTHRTANGDFYDLTFTIDIRNDSDHKITNENLDSLNLKASLLNVNGMGRADADLLVPQIGIEPGEFGPLYFYISYITSYLEWKSFDISIDDTSVYSKPVSISGRLCRV
jgi:hypothetical protein